MEDAMLDFSYGPGASQNKNNLDWLRTNGKLNHRYASKPNTHLLSDFFSVMTLLFTDEFDVSLQFREAFRRGELPVNTNSKLDTVIDIWSRLLPHRRLTKRNNAIEVSLNQSEYHTITYNGSDMSDGERIIFYLIAVAISVKQESILIIDEPELHIHKSILKNLFDEIERMRPDVLFVYLTHDIDFAISRTGSTKIWLKSYNDNCAWTYSFLEENNIPEQIYLEILGSRKPILFIEGEKTSIDYELYTPLFTEYTVKPIGGCSQVLESTKSFNNLNSIHHLTATGIIDRDRRTDNQVYGIEYGSNIHVLKVAEIENIFLIEDVVKTLAKKLYKNPDHVFTEVRTTVINIFRSELEIQIMQHTNHRLKLVFDSALSHNSTDWDDLESKLTKWFDIVSFRQVHEDIKNEFQSYLTNDDYNSILRVANIKSLISRSKIAYLCDLADKSSVVRNHVISIIKENSEYSDQIRAAMRSVIF